MFTKSTAKPAPIALGRIDDLLAKIFSVAAAVLAFDVLRNAYDQMHLLNMFWFWVSFAALMIAQFGSLLAAFVFGHMKIWYRAITITTFVALVTWPLQASGPLPDEFKPWIWWSVGFASLAAVGAFNRTIAFAVLISMPIVWLVVRTSEYGGRAEFIDALDESLYSFFFSTSIGLLVMFLRHRASQVDREFNSLQQTRLERAFLDVVQFERVKINSIIHDNVIATLDAAADASSQKDREAVAASAAQAIARLNRERAIDPGSREQVSSQSFFESLKVSLERRSQFLKLIVKSRADLTVPVEVAVALAEATFQALSNSIEHAASATKREITLSSSPNALKVTVVDNGPGFRMARVPKSHIGVRVAIFKRLETAGIKANLKSAPGEGTTWVFEWSKP
jgi:signal transduction histidine kinase